ncbi:hypothetical protein L2E82_21383 [Cichorium intybus]|uniref:Uncharacterized protein n=1 Tax=Cichorium intybus TaxID=13427 RepID=A0ACB9DVT9_CICIN|nr:hypothetical protein L2E82_21383 [Cichorium intybus]
MELQVFGRIEKAREILDEALESNQLSNPILEALIHTESILSLPKQIDRRDSLHRKLSFHQVFLVSEVELNIYLEIDDFDGILILMAAGDTFRAAPSDQLGIWAERTGCEIVLAEKEKAKASSGR